METFMDSTFLNTTPTSGPGPAASDVEWVKAIAGTGLVLLGGSRSTLGPVLRVAALAGGGALLYGVAKRAGWLQQLQTVAASPEPAHGEAEAPDGAPSTRTWDVPASASVPGETHTAIADAFESAMAEGPKKS